jgi:hypothetical protein
MDVLPPWVCSSGEWCLPDFPIRLLEICQTQESKRSFLGHWSTFIEPRVFSDADFLQSDVSEQPKKTGIWTQGSKPKRNCKSTCPWRRQQRTIRLLVLSGTHWHPRLVKRKQKEHSAHSDNRKHEQPSRGKVN